MCALIGPRTVLPLSTFHTLAVPSYEPLTTPSPSALQHTECTLPVCPAHFAITFSVSTFHNLTVPSLLPLATVLPFGDNAMHHTSASSSSSRQSSPICAPLSRSHRRSEPSIEHVMMLRPLGKCTMPMILLVWPRIVWRGFITDVLFTPAVDGSMVKPGYLNCS